MLPGALLAAAVAGGVVATVLGDRGSRGLAAPGVRSVKTLVPVLLLLALGAASILSEGPLPHPLLLFAVGLAATAVADWLLAPVDNAATFVPGLAAFLAGYALYGAALLFWWQAGEAGAGGRVPAARVVAVYSGVAVIGLLQFARLTAVPAGLRAPLLGYLIVVSNLLAGAVLLLLAEPSLATVTAGVGALSIYVSDSLIAHNLFRQRLPREELWIMPSYYLGQALMTLAALQLVGF